ncbi:MAG: MarR family transcriptional regulator [Solimonas sp.]
MADFRYLLRRFHAFSEAQAAGHGLTPQQHQALLAIRGVSEGAATVGYVADRLFLKPHSATGLVNRLDALGLILRRANPEDRRQSFLTLSAKGQRRLDALSAIHREEIRRLKPLLGSLLTQWDEDG